MDDAGSFERFSGPFSEAMFLVSSGGLVLACNAAAGALCGGAPPDVRGRPVGELVADPLEKVQRYLGLCARSRAMVVGALAFRAGSGALRECRVDGALVRPRDGASPALVLLRCRLKAEATPGFAVLNERIEALSREINDRRRAEAELHAQREWLRITLASIGDAVIATDREGRVTFMNPVAESLTGWQREEAAGRPLAETFRILDEDTREPTEDPVSRVLREGRVVTLSNHTLLRSRRGTERPIEDSAAPIRDEGGKVVGVVLVFRDAGKHRDEARRREELLAREKAVRQQAEAASRMKDEFLAMLSHELRTPLGAISGWVHLLRQAELPPDQAAHGLAVIDRNVRAQTQLIGDLLDASRISSGKLSLDIEPVDIGSVVEAAMESVRLAAVAKGISVRLRPGPGVGFVHGDADRLQQVVWNVLQNAIKFTPGGGRVEIDLRAEGSLVQIAVTDSGVGVAPELLPHLFERFRQADSSITRRHGGLGLGLTLVRQLVELHGGTVQADSPGEGEGTTITIRLPRRAAPVEAAPPLAERDAPRTSEPPRSIRRELDGVRVLLVDDDGDSRELLRLVLQRCGAEVDDVASADEALERLRLCVPDVLISDISMPGQDGYSLIRRLRALPEAQGGRVPALALTALARRDDMERALREGFQVHLTKPVRPPALSAAVARVLGREPPGAA
ncbi:ATP-binding protein [Sorangium sp. So ce1036]|uniref:hybrid sensor histidine kinase/response regulator n=1 Tax=Sorangium sp. So ce1036 TaxID=3133328 RepID=UPI003EFCABB5